MQAVNHKVLLREYDQAVPVNVLLKQRVNAIRGGIFSVHSR
jgi:hypothetical protein